MASDLWLVARRTIRKDPAMVKYYRDLKVWQRGMDLTVLCYQVTESFPKKELYGLTSQIQRAAVSIPSNIAEGQQRQHTKDFVRFLSIAQGSLGELETQLELADRLDYLDSEKRIEVFIKTDELGRMLGGLIRSLKKKLATSH